METTSNNIPRSIEMITVGYFFSKYIEDDSLSLLNVDKWKDAYKLFYNKLGDGRKYRQFERSLKNSRDAFDSHIENSRRGWFELDRKTPKPLTGKTLEVFEKYKKYNYQELLNIVKEFIEENIVDQILDFKQDVLLTSSLLSYIIKSIKNQGGEAKLSVIYKEVNNLSKNDGVDYLEYYKDRKVYTAQVRRAIYLHSSDCDIYKKSKPDLFKAPAEKGKGLWSLRSELINNNDSSNTKEETTKEIHIRKNAAITGNKAEELFEIHCKDKLELTLVDKGNLTDEHGYGYDFLCQDEYKNEFYVEIKGCKEDIDSIRMTKNEWKVAKDKGEQYLLVIVSYVYGNPKFKKYVNPYKLFENKAELKEVRSITMHIKKNDLV